MYFASLLRSAALASVLGLALSGCTDAAPKDTTPTDSASKPATVDKKAAALLPSDVKETGALTFASDASYAPFEYFDTDNKTMVGFDIDLTDALAATLGMKAKHVNAGFDTILPGLAAAKYDAGASAFSVTDERRKVVDFVPYIEVGSGLAVKPDNPEKFTLDDPSTLCGASVAAQKGSIQGIETLPKFSRDCVSAGEAPVEIQLYPSQNQANLALGSGRAAAVMADSAPLAYEATQSGGQFELAEGADYERVPLGIAVPNDAPIGPALAAAMNTLQDSGRLEEMLRKWSLPEGDAPTSTQLIK